MPASVRRCGLNMLLRAGLFEMAEKSDQLETDQVFIDTQAFFRERFDWESKSLARLQELVQLGHLHVLTTSITVSEVRGKIREGLEHARGAMRKHDVVLEQLNNSQIMAALNGSDAEARLNGKFDNYLKLLGATSVPLSRNVDQIFDDYFNENPPFSAKKKSEFPDAFVVSSLRERAQTTGRKIYVVSGDPDMRACCEHAPELIVVENLTDLISLATVTRTFHDNLLAFLQGSALLAEKLGECLAQSDVVLRGTSRSYARLSLASAEVHAVDEIEIEHLNVISQEGNRFVCEIIFYATVELGLEISVETHEWAGEEEHEWSDEVSTGVAKSRAFYAELEFTFDPQSPEMTSFEHVSCPAEIEIEASEIEELRHYIR